MHEGETRPDQTGTSSDAASILIRWHGMFLLLLFAMNCRVAIVDALAIAGKILLLTLHIVGAGKRVVSFWGSSVFVI